MFRGQPVFTTQPINPAWRPCYRRAPETPIVSTVMRKVHGITFHFLSYLWRAGVRGQPAPVMARPPETPPNKSLDTANLSPLELDWLFAHIESRRFTDPEYEVYRFILAVARFTTIPLAGLSQDGLHVGLLLIYPRPTASQPPPRIHR